MGNKESISACAKINLFLDVLESRPDGYHDIMTVFAPLSRPRDCVEVEITATDGILLNCQEADLTADADNICWQAAVAFADQADVTPRWRINLKKQIPIAAGLGGGSADAAATLLALNKLYNYALAESQLQELASRLGADVPFFLRSVPALGVGKGDELRNIQAPTMPLVLINPGFPVSAAWAYQNYARSPAPPPPPIANLLESLRTTDLAAISRCCYNRLEYALFDKFPVLQMIQDFLCRHGCLCAHVSGSGPTIFGIGDAATVRTAAGLAAAEFGDAYWIATTSTKAT